jgi:hypothetical protein
MSRVGRPHSRPTDGELVVYLFDLPDGKVQPLNLLGDAIGEPTSEQDATGQLDSAGLQAVDGAWWALAPTPLNPNTDLGRQDPAWSWRAFVIVEVTPDMATLRLRYPAADELSGGGFIELPAGGSLRRDPPD